MLDFLVAFALIVAAIAFRIFYKPKSAHRFCKTCGHVGDPATKTKGSIGTELLLWIFIVPGILYSIWRLTTRHDACAKCAWSGTYPARFSDGKKAIVDASRRVIPVAQS